MKISFGVITTGNSEDKINKIYQSIQTQNINKNIYELIVVGGNKLNISNIEHIEFNESVKPSWITRKKNIIAKAAKFENLCIMHDYYYLEDRWYENFLKFGEDWDVCMNSIINIDGQRFRDWITWPELCPEKDIVFLDYDDHSRVKQMYVSGGYFLVKKDFFLKNPLDENLCWGQSEDVEWSKRVNTFWNYKCNKNSIVRLMKQKNNSHWYSHTNSKIKELWNKQDTK